MPRFPSALPIRSMAFVVHNTYSKRKEPFETQEPGVVRMYNCGPTVYGRQHVGNFRTFLFADLLRRWLVHKGYEVRQVMNITDVGHLVSDGDEGEDKVQLQARKEGKDPFEISAHYARLFLDDLAALDAAHAVAYPRATQYVPQMLEIVDGLGQRSRLVFSAFEANAAVAPERLRFVPAPGMDVIDSAK